MFIIFHISSFLKKNVSTEKVDANVFSSINLRLKCRLKIILHEAKKREISFPILFVKQFDDPLFCVQNGAIKIRALNLPLGLTATQLCAHVKSSIKSASTI